MMSMFDILSFVLYYPLFGVYGSGEVVYLGEVGPSHVIHIVLGGEGYTLDVEGNLVSYAGRTWIDTRAVRGDTGSFCVERGGEKLCFVYKTRDVVGVDRQRVYTLGKEFGEVSVGFAVYNEGRGVTKVSVYCESISCKPKELFLPAGEIAWVELNIPVEGWGIYTGKVIVEDVYSGHRDEVEVKIGVGHTWEGILVSPFLYTDVLYPSSVIRRLVGWMISS